MAVGFKRTTGENNHSAGVASDAALDPGKRTLTAQLPPIQRSTGSAPPQVDGAMIHRTAEQGVAGTAGPLPYRDQIQRLFGRHDVGGIEAHVGGEAATASRAIGAEAYASGRKVAFAAEPSLHTAAHEAAHVVQQRAGVQLLGGVGQQGDIYEQHADAVADLVVQGTSAEAALDRFAPGPGAGAMLGGRPAVISGAAGLTRAIQRKPGDPAEPEHLESDAFAGDARLDAAYHNSPPLQVNEHSDAVAKMQTALADSFDQREVMPQTFASGQADGIYGNETSRSVRDFQVRHGVNPPGGWEAGHKTLGTMDRLLKGKSQPKPPDPNPPNPNPPNPNPPNPNPPNPVPPPISDELEIVLDRIEVAYQNMITRQRDGVQAVIRDLTPVDAQEPSTATIILLSLLKGLATFAYGAGEGVLRKAILDALSLDPDANKSKVLDNANDKVFDQMWGGSMSLADQLAAQGPKDQTESRANLLADFADKQLEMVTQAGFFELDAFEKQVKPDLRKPVAPDPKAPPGDPRLPPARRLLQSVNQATKIAFNAQYDGVLQRWTRELGHNGGGLKLKTGDFGGGTEQVGLRQKIDPVTKQPVIDPDTNQPVMEEVVAAKQSLDLSPLKQRGPLHTIPDVPPGIISATLAGDFPGRPVGFNSAHIDGLSARTRTKLKDKTVAQAGISIVAHGPLKLPGPPDPDVQNLLEVPITVGVNEVGHVFNLTDDFSHEWLELEGGGDVEAGARKVGEAIKQQKIGDLGSG